MINYITQINFNQICAINFDQQSIMNFSIYNFFIKSTAFDVATISCRSKFLSQVKSD